MVHRSCAGRSQIGLRNRHSRFRLDLDGRGLRGRQFLVLPGLAILWFATLAVIISMAYSKQVATQQYALLALVGAAAERSMPLETAFAAFGHERGGWMRQRTAEIVDMLVRRRFAARSLEGRARRLAAGGRAAGLRGL